jgi:archaellum component FlaC
MEIEEVIEKAINDFQTKWQGYEEMNEGIKKYANEIRQSQTKEIEELKETIKNQDMTINFLTSKW